jgi:hypothetical protein
MGTVEPGAHAGREPEILKQFRDLIQTLQRNSRPGSGADRNFRECGAGLGRIDVHLLDQRVQRIEP